MSRKGLYKHIGSLLIVLVVCSCSQRIPDFEPEHLSKYSIVVTLNAECPISQFYTRQLNYLNSSLARNDSIRVIGIFPASSNSQNEIRDFVKKYGINFDVFIDRNNNYCKQLNATVTPEVFILDSQRNILYQGAIDDRYVAFGETRSVVTRKYLKENIEDLIQSKPMSYQQTEAVGCLIEY